MNDKEAETDALSVVLATGGYDNTIRFWEAWSGICVKSINHPQSQINRLAISPDKRFLAVAGNAHVRLYDVAIATSHAPPPNVAAGQMAAAAAAGGGGGERDRAAQAQAQAQVQAGLVASFTHASNVTSVAWHCEGKWLVTGSEDGTMRIWDTRSAAQQRTYDHKTSVNDVAIHPNQGEIVSCDQAGSVKIWDLAANSCTHELLPEEDVPQRSVSIASDGSTLVSGNNHGNVFMWNISSGRDYTDLQARARFAAHKRYCLKVLLSPDTKQLATCSADTTVKIWSLQPPSSPPSSSPTSPSRHPRASDPSPVPLSLAPLNPVLDKTLYGHQRWVWDMAFSADSAYLVSASSDHSARLWELASGQTVRQYAGHSKPCVAVALNDINIG